MDEVISCGQPYPPKLTPIPVWGYTGHIVKTSPTHLGTPVCKCLQTNNLSSGQALQHPLTRCGTKTYTTSPVNFNEK